MSELLGYFGVLILLLVFFITITITHWQRLCFERSVSTWPNVFSYEMFVLSIYQFNNCSSRLCHFGSRMTLTGKEHSNLAKGLHFVGTLFPFVENVEGRRNITILCNSSANLSNLVREVSRPRLIWHIIQYVRPLRKTSEVRYCTILKVRTYQILYEKFGGPDLSNRYNKWGPIGKCLKSNQYLQTNIEF